MLQFPTVVSNKFHTPRFAPKNSINDNNNKHSSYEPSSHVDRNEPVSLQLKSIRFGYHQNESGLPDSVSTLLLLDTAGNTPHRRG
mmetsp:Transcript_8537/g.9629  ORF Transcript_8537/g.9629 Transcript_8537/m.9629 type:complete len:85 (-) Transcript_8537:39-293(-)